MYRDDYEDHDDDDDPAHEVALYMQCTYMEGGNKQV